MINETIKLKDFYPVLENEATLTSLCPSNYDEWSKGKIRKCVLVIPGGAYAFVSDREGEPIALKFVAEDIACFVLNYTVAPKLKYPYPLVEVYAALAYIRNNAEKYHVDKDKIAVLGFSAGGHLAAITSVYHQSKEFADYLGISLDDMKINGCMLGYPVISNEYGHAESFRNITQERPDLYEMMSVEKHISPSFPKTFIWHTTFDNAVPLKNSLILTEKLWENKVFVELHVYPLGDHGQSTCGSEVYDPKVLGECLNQIAYNKQWWKDAIHFVKEYL